MLQQELLLALADVAVTVAALSAVAGVVKHQALSDVSSGLHHILSSCDAGLADDCRPELCRVGVCSSCKKLIPSYGH